MPVQTKVVVIGALSGGPHALTRLLKRLPADFPAAVIVVVHICSHDGIPPKILEKDSRMVVRRDGEES